MHHSRPLSSLTPPPPNLLSVYSMTSTFQLRRSAWAVDPAVPPHLPHPHTHTRARTHAHARTHARKRDVLLITSTLFWKRTGYWERYFVLSWTLCSPGSLPSILATKTLLGSAGNAALNSHQLPSGQVIILVRGSESCSSPSLPGHIASFPIYISDARVALCSHWPA